MTEAPARDGGLEEGLSEAGRAKVQLAEAADGRDACHMPLAVFLVASGSRLLPLASLDSVSPGLRWATRDPDGREGGRGE